MNAPVYVLDANVFIQAARRYYAFDLAPKFWESLIEHAANGRILSIDHVKQELGRGRDELAYWVTSHFSEWFASTDEQQFIQSYGEIMTSVQAQSQYSNAAKADFASGADGWLVAYTRAKACILVTQEVPAPDARRTVPIPNVCQEFNVQFVDTFEMLRGLGVRFA